MMAKVVNHMIMQLVNKRKRNVKVHRQSDAALDGSIAITVSWMSITASRLMLLCAAVAIDCISKRVDFRLCWGFKGGSRWM